MAYTAPTGDFVTSTLNGAITAAATTATIGTGLNIPAANGILQIDYDSSTAVGSDNGPETIAYTAYNTSTGALTGVTRGIDANTTGVAHANGAKVQCGMSSMYYGQGVIKNTDLNTTAGEPGGAWKAWTPTFANFTKGSATIAAYYTQVGKTIIARLSVTLAADSSMGSNPTFTLPVTSIAVPSVNHPLGALTIIDANAGPYRGYVEWATTTTAKLLVEAADQTYNRGAGITNLVPMTWTTSDGFFTTITYEAA